MNLLDKIGVYCVEHHITRREFANSVGMSYGSLWQKCSGRVRFSLNEALQISQKIDVSIGDIVKMLS